MDERNEIKDVLSSLLWEVRVARKRIGCILLILALPLLPVGLVVVAWVMGVVRSVR